MNTAKAIEMFRTLPADEHPGGLAECAALVLAELDSRGAAIERVRALCAKAKPGRPALEPAVFVAEVLAALDGQ